MSDVQAVVDVVASLDLIAAQGNKPLCLVVDAYGEPAVWVAADSRHGLTSHGEAVNWTDIDFMLCAALLEAALYETGFLGVMSGEEFVELPLTLTEAGAMYAAAHSIMEDREVVAAA